MAFAVLAEFGEQYIEPIKQFVIDHKAWAAPITFVLAFGESMPFLSLVLPFWGLLVFMGTLVGGGFDQTFVTILVAASLGAALGDWLAYWLGFHYHEQIGRMWPLNKHPELLPRGKVFFEKWGVWAIVIARFSGPLRASVPVVAGAAEMPWLRFQIANFASAFLWAFVLLKFGNALGEIGTYVLNHPWRWHILGAAAAAGVVGLALWRFATKRN